MIDTEILHFGRLGAEKIEFEVGRSNFKNLEKCQIFFNFLLGGYFNFETQSPIKIIYFFKYFMTLISSDKRRKYMKCLGYIKLKYPPPKKSLENCNIPKVFKFDLPT